MTEPDPRAFELARSTLRLRQAAVSAGPECLDDDRVAALADGTLDEAGRNEALQHLARCAHCRSAVASVARALADPEVAAADIADDRAGRRWIRVAVPAAAAAVLVIALLGRQGGESPASPSHRAPAATTAEQPAAISPLGAGARPARLRWNTVPDADLYRVTLFHPQGRVLYEVELQDTTAALPDSIRLMPGESYLWKVDARVGWDRWSSSRMFQFSVAGEPLP